jgi:hypothetical protein
MSDKLQLVALTEHALYGQNLSLSTTAVDAAKVLLLLARQAEACRTLGRIHFN